MDKNRQRGLIIGLTGQTGAGKSTICSLLSGRGFRIIDADLVAREVVETGEKCLLDLSIEFGIEILNADGTLNRRKLADIVFSDKGKRARLNRITHPYILERISLEAEELLSKGEPAVFLDAPTLFESGGDSLCDRIVSVVAPAEERVHRIMSRDGLERDSALLRVRAQFDDDFYTGRSDFVIENSTDLSALRVLVVEMLERLGIDNGGVEP